MNIRPHPLLPALLALMTSCGGKPDPAAARPPSDPVLTAVFSTPPAGDPGDIHRVRDTAGPGDAVTLRGMVMGVPEPFVDGRAVFILGDPRVLTPCNARPGDGCPTPWDTCCDSAEDKRRGTATVQVVDSAGQVLRQSLRGMNGLAELGAVTVQGKVAPGAAPGTLVVNATAIRVEPAAPAR